MFILYCNPPSPSNNRDLPTPLSIGGVAVSSYGGGSGPIVLDGVDCTGNETDILSCPSSGNVSDCDHSKDLWIDCSPGHEESSTPVGPDPGG